MALTYDIKSDIRYKEGEEANLFSNAKNMLLNNFSPQQVKIALNVTDEYIKNVLDSLKKK
jgi:hypothetical protein